MTTEDNKDQEALAIMSARIRGRYGLYGSLRGTAIELTPEQITSILADGLSALSEAGYTVVKTDFQRGRCPVCHRNIGLTKHGLIRTHGGGTVGCAGTALRPVPESDTLGGGANG